MRTMQTSTRLPIAEAAAYLSEELGRSYSVRDIFPGHDLGLWYQGKPGDWLNGEPLRKPSPDAPRLQFREDDWRQTPAGGTLLVYLADRDEVARLRAHLRSDRDFFERGSVRRDVEHIRAGLTEALGWTLSDEEEEALRLASVARACPWPFHELAVHQRRPRCRVWIERNSLEKAAQAAPARFAEYRERFGSPHELEREPLGV